MYTRELIHRVQQELAQNPAVAILGPRQVGKTTLAWEIAQHIPSVYLDLENPEDLQKLNDPTHYMELHQDELVILDEIQRYPDLLMSLRGIIDQRRREKKGTHCFLLLGSASRDLLRQSSESLAGRICYLELFGLNPFEVQAHHTGIIRQLWFRGGFPNSFSAKDDQTSTHWRQNFIRTYLERDIPQLGPRIPATTLLRFWTMLAHTHGEPFNASKLSSSLGFSHVTIRRYLDLMVDLLLVRTLHPWSGNIKKQLVKSPRSYIRDSGILHSLLNIPHYEQLLSHPIIGKSWEGFVIENIISCLPSHILPFFYRTSSGAEIDLLLEIEPKKYWAIEIKVGRKPVLTKGFHVACADLCIENKFIIYSGVDIFPLKEGVMVMPLMDFLQTIKKNLF